MEKVIGIGGLFFRSNMKENLAAWYETHLGVPSTRLFWQQAGPTVWAAFDRKTEYFGAGQDWMATFRVRDLDAFVRQLRAAGVEVAEPTSHETGRFARLRDPEGNVLELWEPVDDADLKRIEEKYSGGDAGS